MAVRFSILIPAFKAKYLKECIDSVLSQTFKDFEIVIVNDASPENVEEIVKKYNDRRIKYYLNESNIGAENVVENWNKCLQYSSGDYVICMGDDDKLLPSCLDEYEKLLCQYPGIGLLHGWTEIIDEHSKVVELTTHRCNYETAMSLLWHRMHAYSTQYIGDFCYNSLLLKENGGFYYLPLAWGSDDISAIIAADKNGVANTQKVVFQYRRNSQTISKTGNLILKMHAVLQKEEWLNNYLHQDCENPLDVLYQNQLKAEIPVIISKEKSVLISYDLKNNSIFRIAYWIRYRKRFSLSTKTLLRGFIKALA